jgi:lipopolysaccharide export system protein LptC
MAALAPPPAAPRRRVQPLLWRLQSLLASYVPLLLMAILAGFTWWLIKSTPLPDEPREKAPVTHVPDYQMSGFELERFGADGRLLAKVRGQALRHYPDNDTVEIDHPELRAYGAKGELLLATALRGVGNGDGSELQLMGEVKVRRYPQGDEQARADLQLEGPFVHALVQTQHLRSHLPVRVSNLGGEIQAQSFDYDHLAGTLRFGGPGRAQFAAPARRQP